MYELLKVLHITSVIVWMGSMILAAALPPAGVSEKSVAAVRLIMNIGISVAWIAGLYLAQQGGWFSDGWLHAKLAIATLLAGLHGVIVSRLRGRAYASGEGFMWVSLPWLMMVTVFAASYLVIVKPF